MLTPRQRQFLYAQTGWMLATIALLSTIGQLRLQYVFVSSFVGFALLVALTAPVHAVPRWRSRLRWPLVVGSLVFGTLVVVQTVLKFFGLV
jgi:hypothetical protein